MPLTYKWRHPFSDGASICRTEWWLMTPSTVDILIVRDIFCSKFFFWIKTFSVSFFIRTNKNFLSGLLICFMIALFLKNTFFCNLSPSQKFPSKFNSCGLDDFYFIICRFHLNFWLCFKNCCGAEMIICFLVCRFRKNFWVHFQNSCIADESFLLGNTEKVTKFRVASFLFCRVGSTRNLLNFNLNRKFFRKKIFS